MKQFLLLLATGILCLVALKGYAQQTQQLTLTAGADWKDAWLHKDTRSGYEHLANTNFGTRTRLSSIAWTKSGAAVYMRSLMRFELSALPEGAAVVEAKLYLYSDPSTTASMDINSATSGSNAFFLEKVTQPWNEASVTWNNQPATTPENRVWVAPSSSAAENLVVDVTPLVQDMAGDSLNNHGLKMTLENEMYFRSRNYASEDNTNAALRPKLVVTYTTSAKGALDYIFANVDPTPVTTGLLADYGVELVDLSEFSGTINSSSYVSYGIWSSIYTSLHNMSFKRATLPDPEAAHQAILNESILNSKNNIHGVNVLLFDYHKFKETAVSSGLVTAYGNRLYAGNVPQAYDKKTVFAAAPKHSYFKGPSHRFKFNRGSTAYYLTNSSQSVASVQLDCGDGRGYRVLSSDGTITATYSSDGVKVFKVKLSLSSGAIYESHSQIMVVNTAATASPLDYASTTRNLSFPLVGFSAPKSYMPGANNDSDGVAEALVTIGYNGTDQVLDKPLIVVEGFDAWHIVKPDDPDENYAYEDFAVEFGSGFLANLNVATDPLYNRQLLQDLLENAGYDIVFIDFEDGTDYVQRNAYLVQNVIGWVNANKVGNEQNVVWGMSMGGLVARYALRDMEVNNVAHDTRLYISLDSPHRGANVPVSVQAMVHHLNAIPLLKQNVSAADYTQIKGGLAVITSPAAQQMLTYQVKRNWHGKLYNTSEAHTQFMNQYQALGMPQLTSRNIAIASGSECGMNQLVRPHDPLITINGRASDLNEWWLRGLGFLVPPVKFFTGGVLSKPSQVYLDFNLRALPDRQAKEVYSGRVYIKKRPLFGVISYNINITNRQLQSTSGMLPLESYPGGIYDLEEFGADFPATVGADATITTHQTTFGFVPTYSALSIGEGLRSVDASMGARTYSPASPPTGADTTPFDNFFTTPQMNQFHIQLTGNNASWLFSEIQGTSAFFSCAYTCSGTSLTSQLTGPSNICSGSGDTQYRVSNVPQGATVTWSVPAGLTIVSGQGTSTLTVRAASGSTGTVQLQAQVNGPCGPGALMSTSVRLGNADISVYMESPTIYACPGELKTVVAYVGGTDANLTTYATWTVPSGWVIQNQYQNGTRLSINVLPSSSYGTVTVRVNSSCGTTVSASATSTKGTCLQSATAQFNVYPNPNTSGELNIYNKSQGTESEEVTYEIALYDNFGNLFKKEKGKGKLTKLDVHGLRKGFYHVIISTGGTYEQHHLQVE